MEHMEHKLEAVLESLPPDGALFFTPLGTSMFPLFLGGRDQVCVTPISPDKLRRADVVLYRRDNGMLVIHRIWKIKTDGFYMVGDNQTQPEGPLRPQQIKAVMISVRRKGTEISCHNLVYVLYSHIWLSLRPVRHLISRPLGALYRLLKKES